VAEGVVAVWDNRATQHYAVRQGDASDCSRLDELVS
jgi:alpha-ketoglutarate-dependent taurine dioxygenase